MLREGIYPITGSELSAARSIFFNNHFKSQILDIGESSGATRKSITKQQLENLTVILPPSELQEQFTVFVEQVDKSKEHRLLRAAVYSSAANRERSVLFFQV